jgi:hypothetical protein
MAPNFPWFTIIIGEPTWFVKVLLMEEDFRFDKWIPAIKR